VRFHAQSIAHSATPSAQSLAPVLWEDKENNQVRAQTKLRLIARKESAKIFAFLNTLPIIARPSDEQFFSKRKKIETQR